VEWALKCLLYPQHTYFPDWGIFLIQLEQKNALTSYLIEFFASAGRHAIFAENALKNNECDLAFVERALEMQKRTLGEDHPSTPPRALILNRP
jgi:hypothetical protein